MSDTTQHDIDLAIESLIHDISANSKVRAFVIAENPPNAHADAVFDFAGQRSVSWVAYRELIVARLFDIQSLIRPTQETDPVQHNHRERVEGCFRCDLSAQEIDAE